MTPQENYRWMEFYKIKFKADAYNEVIGKLVLRRVPQKWDYLDGYNKDLGAPPFKRFYVGGTGLFGGRFDGRELVPLEVTKTLLQKVVRLQILHQLVVEQSTADMQQN